MSLLDTWSAYSQVYQQTKHSSSQKLPAFRPVRFTKEKYGSYIPKKKQDELVDIGKRILVTDKSTFHNFELEWNSTNEEDKDFDGIRLRYGDFIALNNLQDVWDRIASDDIKASLTKSYDGNEQKAKEAFETIIITNFTIHEIVHMFQDNSLPTPLLEAATRYYQQEISQELYGWSMTFGEFYDNHVEIYKSVIKEHGDDAHKVFFGSAEKQVKSAVKDLFSQKAMSFSVFGKWS